MLTKRLKLFCDLKIGSHGALSNFEACLIAGYSRKYAENYAVGMSKNRNVIDYVNAKTSGNADFYLSKTHSEKRRGSYIIENREELINKYLGAQSIVYEQFELKDDKDMPEGHGKEWLLKNVIKDPMEFLTGVMAGTIIPSKEQMAAAQSLMAYKHAKKAESSKKAEREEKATQTTQNDAVFCVFGGAGLTSENAKVN